MKKFLSILFVLFIFCISNFTPVYALTESSYYRINNAYTYLYSDPSMDPEYRMFLLPETYFVQSYDIQSNNILSVQYNGISGYIDITNTTRVYGTPNTPYATHAITLSPVSNAIIYSQPTTSSQYLGTLPFDATSVTVFGKCPGESSSLDSSSDWYFIRYTSITQGIITGYIYHSVVQSFVPAPANTEVLETSPSTPAGSTDIIAPELQDSHNIIIILLLLVPALLFVYLLLVPRKKHSKRPQHNSSKLLDYTVKNATKDEFDF